MQTTRRQIISGAAAATVLASAPHAKASTNVLTNADARLEELYREWREAEDAFSEACEIEFNSLVNVQGIEVEGPDGKVQTCKSKSDVKGVFPTPFAVSDFSDADFGVFMVAARGEASQEKEKIMAEIWSRYPDVHAEARETALARLEEAERANRKSPEVQAHKRATAGQSAADDRVETVLGTIAATPAVSLQGVLTKLRIWDKDGMDAGTPAEAVWESALVDLRHLAGEAAS